MAVIGTLNYQISANASEFTKGVNTASASLTGFAAKVSSVFSSMGGGGGASPISGFTNSFANAFSMAGPLGSAIGGGIKGITGFVEANVAQYKDKLAEATKFGSSIHDVSQVKALSGSQWDNAGTGLEKLQRELIAAGDGSEEARGKFRALGLDWASLASMPLTDAFLQTNKAIRDSGGAFEVAGNASRIYGRGYSELLPVISKTDAAIERASKQADLGEPITAWQKTLSENWSKLSAELTKLGNGAAAVALNGFSTDGLGKSKSGTFADFRKTEKEFGPAGGAEGLRENDRIKAEDEVLQKIHQINFTENEHLEAMLRMKGVDDERAGQLVKELDLAKQRREEAEKLVTLKKDLNTPEGGSFQAFNEKVQDLFGKNAKGLINDDEFGVGLQRAFAALPQDDKSPSRLEALGKDTKEAFSAINDFMNQSKADDPQEKVKAALQAALEVQKNNERNTKQLVDIMKQIALANF